MNACVSENIPAHLYFKGSLLPQAFTQLNKLVPLWRWIRQEFFMRPGERETMISTHLPQGLAQVGHADERILSGERQMTQNQLIRGSLG